MREHLGDTIGTGPPMSFGQTNELKPAYGEETPL